MFTLINHATRAAAIHAGLGPLAPLAGRFAEELCRGLFPPDQHKILDNLISVTDIAVCARAGNLQASDELRAKMTSEIANRIGKMLGPEQAGGDTNSSDAARPRTRTRGRLATDPNDLTASPRIELCGTCGGLPESSELPHQPALPVRRAQGRTSDDFNPADTCQSIFCAGRTRGCRWARTSPR